MLERSFYFLRHGETDWNREQRIQGHTDIPLNALGREQAAAVAPLLLRFDIHRIVTSPLSRAVETADILNAVLKKPVTVEAQIKERNFGDFEGENIMRIEELRRTLADAGEPAEENGNICPPNAEPYADFRVRAVAGFSTHLSAFPGENILFITHGGVYRVLNRCLFGETGHSGNVQPFYFEKQQDSKWRLCNLE
jgi:broad specificity phosphatase PhoE